MLRTVEATIDEKGIVRLNEEIELASARRAFVTILDESAPSHEAASLSEAALATDWNRPEEEEAWSHLQPAQS